MGTWLELMKVGLKIITEMPAHSILLILLDGIPAWAKLLLAAVSLVMLLVLASPGLYRHRHKGPNKKSRKKRLTQTPQGGSVEKSEYLGSDAGHWVQYILTNRGIIELDDGSVWSVLPDDRPHTYNWKPMMTLHIQRVSAIDGTYNYVLICKIEHNRVHAKLIGYS